MKKYAIAILFALVIASNASAVSWNYGSAETATWTSASAQDVAVAIRGDSYSSVMASLIGTGTISGGVLTFEVSNDLGTTYFPIALTRYDSASIETTFTLSQTSKLWRASIAGATNFRVRLSTQVSGSGSVAIRVQASSAPADLPWFNVGNLATIGTSVTPGTGATNLGKAEDANSASGDTGVALFGVRNEAAAQLSNADTDYSALVVDAYGAVFTRSDHPKRIYCTSGSPLAVSTATTLTALNGCVAPGAGLSIYVTDISFASNGQAIAADAFPTLKYGTGGTCGSGTAVFWGAFGTAAVQMTISQSFRTPIKIPANNEICWINSTAGSKVVVVSGFIAP